MIIFINLNKKPPVKSVLEIFRFLLINPSNQVLKNIWYIHPYYNMALLLLLPFLIPFCPILLQNIKSALYSDIF